MTGARPLATLVLLGLVFFGSLTLAARLSRQVYDWRHAVISSLASPRDNPHAYGIACGGLAVSGLLLLPFAGYLDDRLFPLAPRLSVWAKRFFRLAAIGLTLSAVIVPGPYRVLGIGRTHEHCAQFSAVAFCLSLVLYFLALLRLPGGLTWLRLLAGGLVLTPVTALVVSRLSLWLSVDFFGPRVYAAIKTSLWSSLAIWEWAGALCVYLFLGLMTIGCPAGRSAGYPSGGDSSSSDVSSSR